MWGSQFQVDLTTNLNLFFRILITSLDQLVCSAKNTSKILYHAYVGQKQKITVSNPLNTHFNYLKRNNSKIKCSIL